MTESVSRAETAGAGSEEETAEGTRRRWRNGPLLVFVAVELVALPLLLVWGRHGWFTQDDWDFLSARTAWNLSDLFRAHFQHWTTLPLLAYRLMWVVVGLRSYTPYQALVVVLHLVAAALLLVVMRRAGVGPWLATIAAVLFVFFGSGAENIVVAFQITFVGALVFGLVQLILADHDGPLAGRDWLGLLAGFAGLLCSGVAITMVAVVGMAVLLRRGWRGWRAALFHTGPLAAAYLVWLQFAPKGQNAGNYRSQSPSQVVRFVWIGIEAAFARLGQVPGVGIALGVVLVGGLFVLMRGRGWRTPLGPLAAPLALLAGGLVFLIVTGVLRSGQGALLFLITGTGPERARDSRYVYIVAALLLPALAMGADALIRLRWQFAIPIVALLLVGLPGNIHQLMSPTSFFLNSEVTRSSILAVPKLPLADQVAGSHRLIPVDRLAAEGLTLGWLVDSAGRIPNPPHIDPTLLATEELRFFLLPKVVTTPVKCVAAPKASTRVLEKQDTLTIEGGSAYVRYVPPGRARSLVETLKPGSYVALAGPMRLRILPATSGVMICQ